MVVLAGDRYEDISLISEKTIKDDNNRSVIDFLIEYMNTIEDKLNLGFNVIITGKIGAGKTFITRAFLNDLKRVIVEKQRFTYKGMEKIEYIEKEKVRTCYTTLKELLDGEKEKSDDYILARESDVLCIDEVNAELKQVDRDLLYPLFDYRYSYHKPVIIVSNYRLVATTEEEGLNKVLGARIIDRLLHKEEQENGERKSAYAYFEMDCPSRRSR